MPRRTGRTVSPLDAADRAILAALVEDGRLPVAEVARRANISRANAYTRIERLTASGCITGYGARLDSKRLGLEVGALVFLRVEQAEWRRLRQQILDVAEVEFVGLTSGEFDFVVLVRATNTDMLRDVVLARLLAMDGVRGTQTLLLFDDTVRGPWVPPA
ncbi:MAG: Lrp/AsnC family transcriptional regulator [Acidimicrobiales bacterium]